MTTATEAAAHLRHKLYGTAPVRFVVLQDADGGWIVHDTANNTPDVHCDTQRQADAYAAKLHAIGQREQHRMPETSRDRMARMAEMEYAEGDPRNPESDR